VGLDAFDTNDMPPYVFKEQLKMVFNVNVTLPELWALVAYFDQESSGSIPCKHFLTQFLRTGMKREYAFDKVACNLLFICMVLILFICMVPYYLSIYAMPYNI
jgi:hypothetical protein